MSNYAYISMQLFILIIIIIFIIIKKIGMPSAIMHDKIHARMDNVHCVTSLSFDVYFFYIDDVRNCSI